MSKGKPKSKASTSRIDPIIMHPNVFQGSEFRALAVVECYSDLQELVRNRIAELDTTCDAVAHLAGLADGQVQKLVCGKRRLGRISLGLVLTALGIRLVAIERADDEWRRLRTRLPRAVFRRWTKRLPPFRPDVGGKNMLAMLARENARFTGNSAWGRALRSRQISMQSSRKRIRIARTAAAARWTASGSSR